MIVKKNKTSAIHAWKMLLLSLPKGIAAFVTTVAGISVSLPLSVFLVGLPLLAETLVLCSHLMALEQWTAVQWKAGKKAEAAPDMAAKPEKPKWEGWKALLAVLIRGRSYRGLLYGLMQLPIGIAAFTAAIVLPVTSWAVMLSPLAYQISVRWYSYDLFSEDLLMNRLLPNWSSYELSWAYAAAGAVLVLLLPYFLRALGRLYAAWILAVSGPVSRADAPVPASADLAVLEAMPAGQVPETRLYA